MSNIGDILVLPTPAFAFDAMAATGPFLFELRSRCARGYRRSHSKVSADSYQAGQDGSWSVAASVTPIQ
jgi:hypothetical protein